MDLWTAAVLVLVFVLPVIGAFMMTLSTEWRFRNNVLTRKLLNVPAYVYAYGLLVITATAWVIG